LVGIEVQPHGREILIKLYEKALEELKQLGPDVKYRIMMENILKSRLKILYETEDVFEIEEKIGRGQIEELIIEAEGYLKHALPCTCFFAFFHFFFILFLFSFFWLW
jgi:NADH dehydrogenase (ubiquinone) 1 alpha subcomplex subunit 5